MSVIKVTLRDVKGIPKTFTFNAISNTHDTDALREKARQIALKASVIMVIGA